MGWRVKTGVESVEGMVHDGVKIRIRRKGQRLPLIWECNLFTNTFRYLQKEKKYFDMLFSS